MQVHVTACVVRRVCPRTPGWSVPHLFCDEFYKVTRSSSEAFSLPLARQKITRFSSVEFYKITRFSSAECSRVAPSNSKTFCVLVQCT
jgi:hypothetical protein